MTTSSPIIYHCEPKDVVVLDLPRSIECAQSSPLQLRSATPPAEPYQSTEPKGRKLTEVLTGIDLAHWKQQREVGYAIGNALRQVKASLGLTNLPWHHPRFLKSPSSSTEEADLNRGLDEITSPDHLQISPPPIVLSSTESQNAFQGISDLQDAVVCNPGLRTCIEVGGNLYHIPPKSTFILSTIVRGQQAFNEIAGHFDIILMDPPWSNRSVRRTQHYSTDESQPQSVFLSTLPILRDHLTARGIIAIWITNRQAVEDLVLSTMDTLGLHLQQEWVWAKITSQGEPVTDLDGVWRKPYEKVLLFGHVEQAPSRRIILAVPDLHSRKPSLKCMFDELLPEGYQALELFARSLTARWWSWGDQVLHFQNASEWGSSPEDGS